MYELFDLSKDPCVRKKYGRVWICAPSASRPAHAVSCCSIDACFHCLIDNSGRYELFNIYNKTKADGNSGEALLTELHGILRQYYECAGAECP